MQRTLLPLALIAATHGHAQIVERCVQNSIAAQWNSVERWNDTLWLFTGVEQDLVPLGARASFLTMDTSGTIGLGGWYILPGSAFAGINAASAHNDRPAVIGGWAQSECAVGPTGFVSRLATSLGAQWHRVLGVGPVNAVADPDTFIHAAWNDQVTVLNTVGDSLTTFSSGMGTIIRMSTVDTLSALACATGAVVLDAPGNTVASLGYTGGVTDIIGYEGVGYALLSNGWLYRTDLNLMPIDSVEHGAAIATARIAYDLSFVWVIDGDSARLFDPGLNLTTTIAMEHPAGFTALDVRSGGAVIMTCGAFTDGPLTAAALRSIDDLGENDSLDIDVRLSAVGFSASVFDPIPGQPGQFKVTGSASVWVVNEGTVPVDAASIAFLSPFSEPCESEDMLVAAGITLLDPGDSAMTIVADVVDTVSWSSPEAAICLHVSSPRFLMDRNTANDEACGSVHVFASVPEGSLTMAPKVFPNPCDDRLFIHGAASWNGAEQVMITDATGVVASIGWIRDGSIDTSGLANGTYLLHYGTAMKPAPFIVAR